MKSWFAKFRRADDVLESALRESRPVTEVPTTLHNSIMRAVEAACRGEDAQVIRPSILQRVAEMRWLPITGLASLVLLGSWLAVSHLSNRTLSNTQPLSEISAAFTATQEVVDALPSTTVGPLSDELDNVGRDIDRTAEFVLAALP
jgi:hypothetical protein